jgi:predicted RND superfamily exporter protein
LAAARTARNLLSALRLGLSRPSGGGATTGDAEIVSGSGDAGEGGAFDDGYIERLSLFFERLGLWSYDHRWIVLAACLAVLAVFLHFASKTRIDNSFENYFDRDDRAYAAYNQYREDFGSDETSYILYEAPAHPHGPWNVEVMRKIQRLTEALEQEVPFVDEVTSLANVEFMEPVDGGLEIFELLEEFPEDQAALLEIRSKVLAKPIYVGGLVSADGRHAALILEMEKSSVDPVPEIRLDPNGGNGIENLYPQVTHEKIEEILARPEYGGIVFHHTGDVPLNAVLNLIVEEDGTRLGLITLVLISCTLLFFFRRTIGVVGPIVVVALSVAVSVGTIGLLGWNIDLMFGMLPTLLIAVGVADAVHIISEFRAYHAELADRREALRRTLYLVGTPCLLTSLTTAAGLGAMAIAPIKALSHFAVYSAVGVLAAFLLSVTLLMVFVAVGRRQPKRAYTEEQKIRAKGGRRFERALLAVASLALRHRRAILVGTVAVFAVSLLGAFRLKVDWNFMTDLSAETPVRVATEYADEVMGGTNSFVYLFDSGVPDGIKDPAVLREVERLQAEADKHVEVVKKTYSIVDLLKDVNQTFHDGDPSYYVLPETRELVAQYILVYEISGGEELENYLSSDYSRASLELRCKWTNSIRIAAMSEGLGDYLEAQPLEAAAVTSTGIGALWVQLMDYINYSSIRGFLTAFAVIALLLCLLFRSLKTGLLAMIPNLSPVILTLGAMGWLDISLNYTTLLVAPVALGIAVDDTMHLVTRYHHEFVRRGSYAEALRASMKEVGRALFITSVVLVLGFSTSVFASMDSQTYFGILLAITIVVALMANFLLTPALILTFEPFGPERETRV